MREAAAPKVSFVSLGCPKALVDSERIITRLRAEGHGIAIATGGGPLRHDSSFGVAESNTIRSRPRSPVTPILEPISSKSPGLVRFDRGTIP